jgi:organic hydroperoxide reductase OsmC/OhrA
MQKHEARIVWRREGAQFLGQRYSRAHEWRFDGGVRVPASSSPNVVKPPLSVVEAVDPEEALVAATASCHMLWFLSIASKKGFVVDSYQDDAYGTLDRNAAGRLAVTRIVLRPAVAFCGDTLPGAADIEAMHHEAHLQCYVANSLKSEVVVEGR